MEGASGQREGRRAGTRQCLSPHALFCLPPPTPDKDRGRNLGNPLAPPRLEQMTVTRRDLGLLFCTGQSLRRDLIPSSSSTKTGTGPVVPVRDPKRSALISNLDVGRKYKFVLYGLVGRRGTAPWWLKPRSVSDRSHPGPAPALCTVLMEVSPVLWELLVFPGGSGAPGELNPKGKMVVGQAGRVEEGSANRGSCGERGRSEWPCKRISPLQMPGRHLEAEDHWSH